MKNKILKHIEKLEIEYVKKIIHLGVHKLATI